MPESYYDPGTQRAKRVQDLFSHIARRYDLLNDLQSFGLHRRWKKRLVKMAEARPGEKALDVCCGTGDLSFALADQGLEVIGLDFTEAMLEQANSRKNRSAHPERISFARGDALQLPFPDSSFNIVTVGYGLRNLADWQRGLAEMVRVLRPGGRVLVLEFGKPRNPAWRAVYFGYLRLLVPLLGQVAAGDRKAYAYILESLSNYPGQDAIHAAMEKLGLSSTHTNNILGGAMSVNFGRR